jgi:PAS domain S-box-containing protein
MALAIEGSGTGLWDRNVLTGEIRYSPGWKAILGYQGAELSTRIEEAYTRVHPDDLAYVQVTMQAHFEGRTETYEVEHRLQCKDGSWKWVLSRGKVVARDGAGSALRMVGTTTDITATRGLTERLRKAEEDLRDQREQLFQAQKMEAVGQLTAGIAHDFNNLLQAIIGSLDMLGEQASLGPEGRECIAIAEDAARRGATLVHRLLAFSRKQTLNPSLLQPAKVLAEITPLIARVLGDRIGVETRIDQPAWPVIADGGQLGDCLLNLAINARDAMPEGGVVRLRVSNAGPDVARDAGLPAGDYTLFAVEDKGTGMSAETAARALEPFFTTKPIGQGVGLGLSMVQGFARQSGGDVRIESAPERGSTVSIWLPRANTQADSLAEPHQEADYGHGRVLLVDDEKSVRQTLALFLTKAGFSPLAVASGEEALELLKAGAACHLLVTDQSMPGLTGNGLIREVSALRPALPAMLITGYNKVSGLDELPVHVTVLRKPFGRATFMRQVQALLRA